MGRPAALTLRQRWLLGGSRRSFGSPTSCSSPLSPCTRRWPTRAAASSTGSASGASTYATHRRAPRKPGYSPTMRIWWRSLVLFDVPIFKYVTAQLGSLGLLSLLLHVAPCFDWDNHQACFSNGGFSHTIGDPFGLSGSILQALDIQSPRRRPRRHCRV